ncbi:hypothetical protein GE21DRAFT_1290485 [Neurospora crassa]|nr:hypothetical protein GE21DRAFT_1290485 [Neurospora crassa]
MTYGPEEANGIASELGHPSQLETVSFLSARYHTPSSDILVNASWQGSPKPKNSQKMKFPCLPFDVLNLPK